MEIDLDGLSSLALKYIAVKADKSTTYAGRRLVGFQFESEATPEVFSELVRRLKAAEQDAARYRWLRDEAWGCDKIAKRGPKVVIDYPEVMVLAEEGVDQAVDAAMAGGINGNPR